ncbi:MAG: hypothetical protein SF182_16210 [Deltaproteobacteria bacterium]|nr:hypothetical protein [Deltaproteobacteria bacterium]
MSHATSPVATLRAVGLALVLMGLAGAVGASDAPRTAPPSATDINRRVTDPVSTTWSLQLNNKLNILDLGASGAPVQDQLIFKPTLPVWLTRELKLIARPDFTLIDDTPYANAAGGVSRTTGVGDTACDLVLSPRLGPWLLALGPTFVFPTANLDQTGQGKWQIGPAGVLGYKRRSWLAGIIWQQWWSFAGAADRRAVSELHVQYIASWFFGDGWNLGTAPTIKVDWRADGEAVTFPFGPALGKVVRLGSFPVKLELRGMYVPIHPDDGPQGMIEFLVTPVIPSLLVGPLVGAP